MSKNGFRVKRLVSYYEYHLKPIPSRLGTISYDRFALCAIGILVFTTMKHNTMKLSKLNIFNSSSTYDPSTVTAGMSRMLRVTAMHAL